jgi:TP901 family phage tail tape measure protein
MKTGLTEAKNKVNSSVGSIKTKLTELKNHHVQMFTAMRNQIPLFGNAMSLLGNPYALIIGGAIAVGAIIGQTTKKAAEFNHEFLPIQQLNLDKPVSQLNNYKESIKSVAFETGQSLVDTTKAFYDIQSATGLFGKDVADITTKVGNFSIMTGAKLPDAVNQTVKAMKAFKLSAADIDMLLASNAKTVQMGITTFDELATVQTEFAGAAAGAGQSVDSANKLFAVFTSVAKDSRTAATMTKTAFEGFTQAATVKGLKEIGVTMYDAKGQMRDMSSILSDVSAKFKGMTSQQIDQVIAKIGGPEGLRNLLVKLKTGSDDLFSTFKKFDETQFDFAKALKNAKGDMTTISNMAKNRLGVISAEIGQKFLPIWVVVLEKVNNILSFVFANFDTIWSVTKNIVIGLGVAKVAMVVFNAITAANPIGAIVLAVVSLITYITIAYKKFDEFGALMFTILGPLGILVNMFLNIKKHWESIVNSFREGGFLAGIKRIGLVLIDAIVMPIQQALNLIGKIPGMDFAKRWAGSVAQFRQQILGIDTTPKITANESPDAESDLSPDENPFAGNNDNGSSAGNEPLSSSINKITGSAKQVKNLTINIDSFVKGGINTEKTTLQNMDAGQLEQYMTDMFLRVIRNVETSY